jgi:creatinine amidohydrolase
MSDTPSSHPTPLRLKFLRPAVVEAHLARDPRLIIPVGTTEQHGPHLPFGADTVLVERLADDLSAEFQVLRAPTVEYGVNAKTRTPYPGNATLRRKTLHRFMNDLVGSWEEGGVAGFVILTAHGHDPHQEALSTLRTTGARVRTVDIFTAQLGAGDGHLPIHGGAVDTSLLLYVDRDLVDLDVARDFVPAAGRLRGWRRSGTGMVPAEGPGSVGRPTRASIEAGRRLYHLIYERIATRVFGRPECAPAAAQA